MTTLTPLRITRNDNMNYTPRSCTGWSCSCSAPYGFGPDRNKICHAYGPSIEATPEDLAKHRRYQRAVDFRKKQINNNLWNDTMFHNRVEIRRNKILEKIREGLEWELDFEDQVRTGVFFDKREQQRAYEADAPERARRQSWESYREAELESSCRSIRSLNFDDC